MSINKINLEATVANWALMNIKKELLESTTWNFKLLPAVKYAEYMAERSAVYEEHRGDRERIISFCADIYNAWEAKNITSCVTVGDTKDVYLATVEELIITLEKDVANLPTDGDYKLHLSLEDKMDNLYRFTAEEVEEIRSAYDDLRATE